MPDKVPAFSSSTGRVALAEHRRIHHTVAMLLIHPPVAKPTEPPAGLARLDGALRSRGCHCRLWDASLEGLLWLLEQPAQAVANGVFIGAVNRVGVEKPWDMGKFYGSSYFVDPRGQVLVKGSDDADDVVMAELDLDAIREVRDGWQFFRDLRPVMYGEICRITP